MKVQRVQRKRSKDWRMPPDTIYVGRPSRWGNPFVPAFSLEVGLILYRNAVQGFWTASPLAAEIDERVNLAYSLFSEFQHRFRKTNEHPGEAFRELKGKNLACWCFLGQPCHADVLLELTNSSGKR